MKIKIKRLIAAYIDMVIAVFSSLLLVYVLTLGNFNLESPIIFQIISSCLYIVIVVLFIIRKDLVFKNASIGKKILGLKIVDSKNNDILDKKVLVNRNKETLFSFPLYPIYIIISNESVGDEKFKTKIIDTK